MPATELSTFPPGLPVGQCPIPNSFDNKRPSPPSAKTLPNLLSCWLAFQLVERSGLGYSVTSVSHCTPSLVAIRLQERFTCRASEHLKVQRSKPRLIHAFTPAQTYHRGLGCMGFIWPGICGGNICCRFAGLVISSPPDISDICLR
jgi:hypothetical protein